MLRGFLVATMTASVFSLALSSGGCSHTDSLNRSPTEAGTTEFAEPDAGDVDPDAGLTEYCPATSCAAPFATCPGARFQCETNLLSDEVNCGSCGFSCTMNRSNATFNCLSGKCVMKCGVRRADCNGIIDDDCEVTLGTNENCNACGDRCPEPDKPCIYDTDLGKGQCGCDPGLTYCGDACVDLSTSDENCSACGIACDRTEGGPPRPHAYYGCRDGTCGHLKCERDWADCDGLIENGCETSLLDPATCGSCTNACDPKQWCRTNKQGKGECLCPQGKTLCGAACVDTGTDPRHCGGCGISCAQVAANKHGVGLCNFGSCNYNCAEGWGDCNDDLSDGCEANLGADPRNCGACGNACEPGQPCVAGRCAVEPCGGGVPAR